MSSILRPYQKEGEDLIFAAWKAGYKNVMYQLVTGGGKTVLFVDIIKKFLLKGKRVMLIAHREELITQAWNTLHKNSIYAGIIKADVRPQYSFPCQVASIQTLIRRSNLPPADLVIIDEAHHSQDDNSYGTILWKFYDRAYVLGVTATPYRLNGDGFTTIFDTLILGPKFKDLVNWGYLTPLRYFIGGVPDLSGVKIEKGDYNQEQVERVMGMVPLVESYGEHCRGMCGVVFGVNVHHSRNIVDQYNAAGIRAAHLDANTPTNDRARILKLFKDRQIEVISNVGIITEGFDFPDMQFVQLARPTLSLALFLQMVGRVTRTEYEAIKNATSDEERFQLVAASRKPFGYVLDNAGCYRTHGMPDQEFNWQRYFNGIDRKKKKPAEFVTVVEYVAEDEDGRVMRTEIPEEVDGLILIEVNTTIREKIVNITSLKEFDRLLEMFKRMPKIPRKGYAALKNYKDYCRKNNVLMGPEVWDYITRKLWTEPQDAQAKVLAELDQAIATAQQTYENLPGEVEHLSKTLKETADKKVAYFKSLQVPSGYLKKERALYEEIIEEGNKNIKASKLAGITK